MHKEQIHLKLLCDTLGVDFKRRDLKPEIVAWLVATLDAFFQIRIGYRLAFQYLDNFKGEVELLQEAIQSGDFYAPNESLPGEMLERIDSIKIFKAMRVFSDNMPRPRQQFPIAIMAYSLTDAEQRIINYYRRVADRPVESYLRDWYITDLHELKDNYKLYDKIVELNEKRIAVLS